MVYRMNNLPPPPPPPPRTAYLPPPPPPPRPSAAQRDALDGGAILLWLIIAILIGVIAWVATAIAAMQGRWTRAGQLASISVVAFVIDVAIIYGARR